MTIMRESKFVEQNKDKWTQFEKDLRDKKTDPSVLRTELIEITDDLSYSRTFYRNRSVRIYLNGLGQQVYNNIYKNKNNLFKSVAAFFKIEVPKILYFCRKELLISFLVLLLSVAIGIFSSAKDEGFARSILGDSYVDMTLENIKKGDPLGVYKQQGQMEMFFDIATNNLNVSLIVFLSGLLASYGALVIMARNGIMLGVFIYFFYSRNIVSEFNLTVWMHGTIEILTLVVETTAGILLGRGLVYPGTLSRIKAFSVWGKRAAMLFLSTVPFIVLAAFIESFLTRHTELPDVLRLLLILLSLALMGFYFVWYPIAKFRNSEDTELGMPDLKPDTKLDFSANAIYSNGQIFLKTIQMFGLRFTFFIRATFICSIVYIVLIAFFYFDSVISKFKILETDMGDVMIKVITSDFGKFIDLYKNLGLLFNRSAGMGLYAIVSLWTSGIAFTAIYIFQKTKAQEGYNLKSALVWTFGIGFLFNLLLLSKSPEYTWIYVLLSPLALTVLATSSYKLDNRNLLQRIYNCLATAPMRLAGVLFLFLLTGFIGMVFIVSPFAYLTLWLMEMNVELSEETYTMVLQFIMLFSFIVLMSFSLLFYATQCIYLSFTLCEISDAKGLSAAIDEIGKSKKAYGMETE